MKYLVLLVWLSGLALSVNGIDTLVSTNNGLIRGLRDDNGHFKFLGVPYGKLGTNIFGVAEPYPAFDGIFEANDDSNFCIQMSRSLGVPIGTADCLNANIYVPESASSNNRLPVMVWIHGGAFVEDSHRVGTSNPLSLLRHDVIVVTVNYRVGVFGFMCLDTPEVPGNAGLKDQVMALRWVNENIEAFDGDINQITLFGVSAGAMSVNLHLFTSYEKLFDRAIMQSGPAFSYWMMVESDQTIPIRLAQDLGFNTTDMNEALSFLMNADTHMIAQAAEDLNIASSSGTNQPITKPCVEQEFEGVEHFIVDHPMNMDSSKASITPVIIGYNSIEFAFQYANVDATFFDTYDFSQHFALGFNMTYNLTEALEVVRHFYIGDEGINENVRWEVIDFGSDFIFNHPTQRMTQKLLASGAETVYRYVFSYSGNTDVNKNWVGATHAEELLYLFDIEMIDPEKSQEVQTVIDRFTELWTNFAKYGDPTPNVTELLPVKWIPITETTQPYLEMNTNLSVENRPFNDRMAFWDLFYQEYGHLQKWYKA